MIDIIRAISVTIEAKYPNYVVTDMDIDEGYERPSYYIDVDSIESEFVAVGYIVDKSDLKLGFFAEERYSGFLELLEMKNELLSWLTDTLIVHDEDGVTVLGHVVLSDVRAEIFKEDKVLQISFSTETYSSVDKKEDNLPYIEDISINLHKGE